MNLKKILMVFLLVSVALFANEQNRLTIDAINFSADDKKNLIVFNGDVKMKRVQDKLNADKLVVNLKENKKTNKKEPIKYTATGKVYLEILTAEKHFICKGDKVVYNPLKNQYIITGNGYAEDKKDAKKLYGDKIYINTISGEAKVDGSKKKPIRFIMQLDTDKK